MTQGKVVLITGCSTGIGRATAELLSSAGYQVVATARRPETLTGLNAALTLPLDVEQSESVNAAVAEVMRTFGRIDMLVNNAGYGQMGALEEIGEAELHRVFEVNVHGPMRLIRAVLPHMRRQGGGRIVNLSSVAGRISFPMMGAYCGTKFAVEAMSDALRGELTGSGIQVVLIEPGAIRTEFDRTARQSAAALMAEANSPYRNIYEAGRRLLDQQNSGAPGPEAVARVIRRALEASRPRARYQVPASMALLVRLLPLLPDRLKDSLVATGLRRLTK